MLRSLFAGVTGLANHQLKLDVIGNNIANVNTVGYKSSSLTFREMLTQTIRGASRPTDGGPGGTNPQQIGLGSSVGSINTNFAQGNMKITGKMTDLAIEGEGFFVLSDGNTNYYSRDGAFTIDGDGNLVNPSNGFKVQGVLANSSGIIEQGRSLEDIVVPTSLILPARATSLVRVAGNLDVDSDAQATITRSGSFLSAASETDNILSLYNESGVKIGGREGDSVNIRASVGGTDIDTDFAISDTSTLQDITNALESVLQSVDAGISVTFLPSGQIQVAASGTNDISELSLQISGNTVFNSAFSNNVLIEAGSTAVTNDELRVPAQSADLLATLYDYKGNSIDLSDDILVGGDVGGGTLSTSTLIYNAGSTTLDDLLNEIRQTFNITFGDVELDDEGRILVTGDAGSDFGISSIDISQVGGNSIFDSAFVFNDIQTACDVGDYSVTTMIYDSLGQTHDFTITFSKMFGQNAWNWDASVDGMGEIVSGGSGSVQFTDAGLLSSFSFDGSAGELVIDPHSGAETINIDIDPGETGSLSGLIQFNRAFSVNAKDIDGQSMGTMQTISIDRNGVINGQFSNGSNRDLAQIAMSDFNNPGGLSKMGENMFIESPNSGQASTVFAGTN
ncbi:flagellar hook-basal body complex protein, partial [bacterium]|nr:flagellar hook-basal body complex protein [bacterium]